MSYERSDWLTPEILVYLRGLCRLLHSVRLDYNRRGSAYF